MKIKATIQQPCMVGIGGTSKFAGKPVRSIQFKKKKIKNRLGSELSMKINGEQWTSCIDVIAILCELGLKIRITKNTRAYGPWGQDRLPKLFS